MIGIPAAIQTKEPPLGNGAKAKRAKYRFERKYGPGSVELFLRLRRSATYAAMSHHFGRKTRQWAHQMDRALTNGAPKPRVACNPHVLRPDLTRELIRKAARRYPTKIAMARALATSPNTIDLRAKEFRIRLPDWERHRRKGIELSNRRIRKLACAGFDAPGIATIVHKAPITIYRRNRKYELGVAVRPYLRHTHSA